MKTASHALIIHPALRHQSALRSKPQWVLFRKRTTGEVRAMYTAPPTFRTPKPIHILQPPFLQVVWDLEKDAWRSIPLDTIMFMRPLHTDELYALQQQRQRA